jgi:nucleotide-binding universal stress UspA family protein
MTPRSPATPATPPRAIVVGTDGSPTATEAVERAAALAKNNGATLHVVTAYDPAPSRQDTAELEALPEAMRWMGSPGQAAEDVLTAATAPLDERALTVERHARPGDPATVLLEIAAEVDADLLVVGNKGMQGAKRFVVPSVPNRVSHRANCDVLIVNTAGAA